MQLRQQERKHSRGSPRIGVHDGQEAVVQHLPHGRLLRKRAAQTHHKVLQQAAASSRVCHDARQLTQRRRALRVHSAYAHVLLVNRHGMLTVQWVDRSAGWC